MVTGVAGFLGSHLAQKLSTLGHKIIGIDNMKGGYEDNIPSGVEFIYGDCGNMEVIKKLNKKVVQKIFGVNVMKGMVSLIGE